MSDESANFLDSGTGFWEFNYAGEACEARVYSNLGSEGCWLVVFYFVLT